MSTDGRLPPASGRVLAHNTLWNVLGQVLPLGLALLAIPPLAAGLGADGFGVLGLAWMVLTFFRELGFGRATTKFVAEVAHGGHLERAGAVVWTTAAAQCLLGLVAGLALALASAPLAERILRLPAELVGDTRTAFLLIAAGLPAVFVTGAFRGALEGMQRFGLVNLVMAPVGAGSFLLPLLAVWLGWGIPGAVGLLVALRIVALCALVAIVFAVLPFMRRPHWRTEDLGALIRFGGWVSVSTILSPVLVYADRALMGVLIGVAAVGYYTAPFEVATRLLILPVALVATLFPAVSALTASEGAGEAGRLAARSVRYLLLTVGPVVVFLLAAADPLLDLWLGPEFAERSGTALRILAVGVLVNALAHVPFAVLQATGRPDVTAKLHMVELPVHLVLTWALVGRWGIAGAAAAWTLRVTVDAAALFLLAYRFAPPPPAALHAERLPRAAALVTASAAAALLLGGMVGGEWQRIGLVGVVATGTLGVAWRYALDEADRVRLLGVVNGAGRG